MNCYYHPERAAVGICKHCGRGLCADCAALVEDTLACSDRHEEAVRGMNLSQRQAALQASRIGPGYIRNAVFYGLIGLVFAAYGFTQYRFLGLQAILLLLIGIFLLYAAIANFVESRKYRGTDVGALNR